MHRVVITVDSTADIPPELARLYDIHIIPLTVILGEESYPDGDGITPEMMYERYHADGTLPKTAAPSVQAFEDFFRPFTEAGDSVVHLDIGSELSNAYNAARLAAADMGSVYVIDSRSLCCGIALLAIEGAECRNRGMSAEEIAARLTALRDKVSVSFVLDTLEFMAESRERSVVIGRDVRVIRGDSAYPARVLDIDGQGRLVIQTDAGVSRLNSGEVSLKL